MAAGLGFLRLPPSVFWAMTPRELSAALDWSAGSSAPVPLARDGLAALSARYPDSL